jgi:hypothetical protein
MSLPCRLDAPTRWMRAGASPATSKTLGADASVFVVSSTIISFVYVVDILDYIFQSNQEKK